MKRDVITIICFACLLGTFFIWNVVRTPRVFSEDENRFLARRPELRIRNLVDEEFRKQWEEYFTDQFPLRGTWVRLHTVSEKVMGKKESNGVYFAREGYLIEAQKEIGRARYQSNLDLVKVFLKGLDEQGVDGKLLLVPPSNLIMKDLLPRFAPDVDWNELFQIAEESVSGQLIDARDVLSSNRGEGVYYRTDHHWTTLGAYYAYTEWKRSNGEVARSITDYRPELLSDHFFGTSYWRVQYPWARADSIMAYHGEAQEQVTVNYNNGDYVTDTPYERRHLENRDKFPVFLNGNQPITEITTANQNGRVLLVVKDSFANPFVPFLMEDFSKIVMVDLRSYKMPLSTLMEEKQVDEVLVLYSVRKLAESREIILLNR